MAGAGGGGKAWITTPWRRLGRRSGGSCVRREIVSGGRNQHATSTPLCGRCTPFPENLADWAPSRCPRAYKASVAAAKDNLGCGRPSSPNLGGITLGAGSGLGQAGHRTKARKVHVAAASTPCSGHLYDAKSWAAEGKEWRGVQQGGD